MTKVQLEKPMTGLSFFREVLHGKWEVNILYLLDKGVLRPGELLKNLPGASRRVLNIHLAHLLKIGLARRDIVSAAPPVVEYHLTALGLSLLPILHDICSWGDLHEPNLKTCMEGHATLSYISKEAVVRVLKRPNLANAK